MECKTSFRGSEPILLEVDTLHFFSGGPSMLVVRRRDSFTRSVTLENARTKSPTCLCACRNMDRIHKDGILDKWCSLLLEDNGEMTHEHVVQVYFAERVTWKSCISMLLGVLCICKAQGKGVAQDVNIVVCMQRLPAGLHQEVESLTVIAARGLWNHSRQDLCVDLSSVYIGRNKANPAREVHVQWPSRAPDMSSGPNCSGQRAHCRRGKACSHSTT
eukprot:3930784-Amphidinium_carterae.1